LSILRTLFGVIARRGPFGELLKRTRVRAGMTQEALAAEAGLSARTVSDLERGETQTAQNHTAQLLADALRLVGLEREAFVAAARGHAPAREPAARTLPRDIASFLGREEELHVLAAAAASCADSSGVVAVHAIDGMAGIGKTTFAVHAAHRLKPQFPDGQIFLPLHGHTSGRPTAPAAALASLLRTIGVPTQQLPRGLEARAALWRSLLADRRLLLLLDDAADSEQVHPLLPGTAGSLVLITSRRRLTALEDAKVITLDTFEPEQAIQLLTQLADRPRLRLDGAALGQIARVCGYLPLAVGMLGRRLAHRSALTPAGLANDLAAARDGLELIATENSSVAAAFSLSYRDLTGEQQRMFRRLGLHPGTDIDAHAAAALDGVDPVTARRTLEDLFDQNLLLEPAEGRYRLHDLMREYAHSLAAREDTARDVEQAIERLLGYYQSTADTVNRYLTRYTRPGASPTISGLDFPDPMEALLWARAERTNLLACLDHAAHSAQHARVAALTSAVAPLLRLDGPWADAIDRHASAAEAARHIGNRLGEANALNDLGILRCLTGDSTGGASALEGALDIYCELGDRQGQAGALNHIAYVRRTAGNFPGAVDAAEAAFGIARDIGDRQGQANALKELGGVRYQTANYQSAAEAVEQSLSIYCDIGDWQGEAGALGMLGNVRRLIGEYHGAVDVLEAALSIYRDFGDPEGQANALNLLGIVRRRQEDVQGAAVALEEAERLYRGIGDRQGEANALNFLGAVRRQERDYQSAAIALKKALGIYRDLHDEGGEAEALNEMGALFRVRGNLDQAREYHQYAIRLAHKIPSEWDEAHAVAGLARCDIAVGRIESAQAGLRKAHQIFERIQAAAEADDVAAELQALDDADPASAD
jgi:tetratricopeptide (TPR) repeat protein/transcriptional regulator with XRE-family HTH domain